MTSISVRRASQEDVLLLSDISRETFYETFATGNSKENMDLYLSGNFRPEQITEELKQENTLFLLAYENNSLAGYAKLSTQNHPPEIRDRNPMEIERIYVRGAFQGKKIGLALMQHCIRHARHLGKDVLWLGVWEHNKKARTFYERAGFVKFSEHDFVLGNDIQTDWLMKLESGGTP